MLALASRADAAATGDRRESPGAAQVTAAGAAPAVEPERSLWHWRPSRPAAVAFVAGLLLTAVVALAALALYNRNEHRLLVLRARELGLVVAATVPSVQTPLASAA